MTANPPPSHLASRKIQPEKLEAFCAEALLCRGMREPDARTVATVLVTTDMWGIFTHGTRHLHNYLRKMQARGIDPLGVPKLISEGAAFALIDGDNAMGMVSACMAMELAIRKAKICGVGYVGVRNSAHFGAAGYYVNMAIPHDMIGIAMSNTDPNMTAPGARGSVIGNNPLAYAVPSGQEKPIFLDIAMSTVASSKILAAKASGAPIPDNWIVDANGVPTTDTSQYPYAGSLLPMGGHKGYGLALLIEVLAGALTGAAILGEAKSWLLNLESQPSLGHAFLAIDVAALMPVELFKARVDQMIRELHGAPLAQGAERIYLPGEMEWENREQAQQHGIPLPADVLADLISVGQEMGIDSNGLFEE